MKPIHSLRCFAFVLAAPLLAQAPVVDPKIEVGYAPYLVTFDVSGPEAPFLGIVIASLSPDLQYYFVGLPPLLGDALVVDWGLGQNGNFHSEVSEFLFPAGVLIHVQGVVIGDLGILSSNVASFVLDVTVPPS
jgi:hypothetical protein